VKLTVHQSSVYLKGRLLSEVGARKNHGQHNKSRDTIHSSLKEEGGKGIGIGNHQGAEQFLFLLSGGRPTREEKKICTTPLERDRVCAKGG